MSPKAINEARHQQRREEHSNKHRDAAKLRLICAKCGALARHIGRLCCRCHVAAGRQPAEWHPECMAAAAALGKTQR